MTILELDRISKSFKRGLLGKKHKVLSDLSFQLEAGEVFGFLGHNGAGKTTTIKIILGLLRPDSGQISILGQHGATSEARARAGFLCEDVGLYPHLTAEEMLQLSGELFSLDRSLIKARKRDLLELVGLSSQRRLRIKRYSKGMRQRLGVAIALLNDPDILLLDEPYSGLDPLGRRKLRKILLSLKEAGKTILLSSHIVPDVEAACDRVGILSGGKISKFLDLREIYATKTNESEVTARGINPDLLRASVESVDIVLEREEAVIARCKGDHALQEALSTIYRFGGSVLEVKPLRFSLEDHLVQTMAETQGISDRAAIEEEIENLLSQP
ncbi:MAG: ATP-binding cassette domain-containing protein [Candidatus Latescibacteria bacterium]|nr:ATP-binding cassette domain-containing protein [Candidatus Latescibacterota bacterium]NIM21005.1 ATP-binding cassette domain-containing protein [Candidatus Latescibacterota bacterium]NIM65140.1 ATP-binding cassette domain-containing protein [Candidatus Latescibacterota bacterium]NIO01655.1 ATP-binding cassette domain-containing protein [Candidatus Latescibacterota bacterium]NIO28172.1 ATP-binding cassette domain-containing protein [Candidatus Latescibacterota bacterium]